FDFLFSFISKIFPQEKANEHPTKTFQPPHSNAEAFEQNRTSEPRLAAHSSCSACSKVFGRRGWFGGGGGIFLKSPPPPPRSSSLTPKKSTESQNFVKYLTQRGDIIIIIVIGFRFQEDKKRATENGGK
ncbi:MAG: hypothetical protein IJW49_09985, partial [Clostridia bacterium]|nr:hypothetical protein [Clostridia bacterium]